MLFLLNKSVTKLTKAAKFSKHLGKVIKVMLSDSDMMILILIYAYFQCAICEKKTDGGDTFQKKINEQCHLLI